MEEAKRLIEELKTLMGKDDSQSAARRDEIANWFKVNHTPENVALAKAFLVEGYGWIQAEAEKLKQEILRDQISDRDYRLLPVGIIAKEYFGKSSSWLSQRLNGTPVRGKVYTLNDEQKATFNRAVKEIGQRIGSFQIA